MAATTTRTWYGMRTARTESKSARFMFFHGTYNSHTIYEFSQATGILKHPKFDNNKPTALYLHGYIETPYVESIKVIVEAYAKRGDHNLLVLDWAELADGGFLLDALPNSKKLGKELGIILHTLILEGLDVNKLHLIGHSLGGQMTGYVSRSIRERSQNTIKLKRITALDPAFPAFYPGILATPISASDAELVDVIHTDAWLYGAPFSTGTVDFWPNKGKTLQPGCPKRNYKILTDNDLCSHRRSWRFWAESITEKNKKSFPAIKCKSWRDFKNGNCEQNSEPDVYMGIDCPMGASGNYYLQTNGEYPFSKGLAGTKYEPKKK